MPNVGDEIELASKKVGQEARRGTVTALTGHMLVVRWSSGQESMFVPGPGAVTVVGQRPKQRSARKKR